MVRTALNCLRVGGWISVVSARFETVSHSLKQLRTVAQSHTVANSCERFETVASSRVQSGPGPCRTAQELGRPAGPDRAKTAVALGGGSRSGGDPSARLATRRPSGVAASRRHKGEAVPCAAGESGVAMRRWLQGRRRGRARRSDRAWSAPHGALCRSAALSLCRSAARCALSPLPRSPLLSRARVSERVARHLLSENCAGPPSRARGGWVSAAEARAARQRPSTSALALSLYSCIDLYQYLYQYLY